MNPNNLAPDNEFLSTRVFPSVEDFNKVRAYLPEKNEENFDRLEQELAKMAA